MAEGNQTPTEELLEEVKVRLGDGMVDVELEPKNYMLALKMAIRRYRQRSANAVEEAFVFQTVSADIATYTLPKEIQEVRAVYRRNIGATGGTGSAIDPFALSFTNNIYMIQNPGGIQSGGVGTLATYDFAMQFQELAGRMFGRDVQFTFSQATKKITYHRKFVGTEEFGLHVYMTQPDDVLLADVYARPWIQDYTTAQAKLMLGEARQKFSQLAGPQGGISLNGDAMKQEAQAEMERLDKELADGLDSGIGWPLTIG
jgi:hypothetical protein